MSDTPETDAEQWQYVPDDAMMYVESNFARKLERERAEVKRQASGFIV